MRNWHRGRPLNRIVRRHREAAIFELLVATLIALAALNLWALWRICANDLSSRYQQWAQLAFVWLVPIVGALVTLQLKREEPERGSGTYPAELDPQNDFGPPGHRDRRAMAENVESSSINDSSAPDQ